MTLLPDDNDDEMKNKELDLKTTMKNQVENKTQTQLTYHYFWVKDDS
jgi:hypothetical protein